MIMTEARIKVADVHDRMPVILRHEDWTDWLDAPPDDARLLFRSYPGQGGHHEGRSLCAAGLTMLQIA